MLHRCAWRSGVRIRTYVHPSQAKRGGLKDTLADDLVATVLKATIDRTGINPADIGR